MQTPEAKVKQFVKKFMLEHFPGAWYYAPPGGMFGRAGTPDLLYLWRGVFIAIEVKAEFGKLTDLQRHYLGIIRDQGGIAACVKGKDVRKLHQIKKLAYKKAKNEI